MKIAIFGAGQLAMMMIEESENLNHQFVVIDPSITPPASKLVKHIRTNYDDIETLEYIAANYDVATIDFENVEISALKFLEKYIKVYPPSSALETCQDRLLEKNLFKKLNINVTEYFPVSSIEEINKYSHGKKSNYLLKSRRFGYDGKNQFNCREDTAKLNSLLSNNECIIEKIVDFSTEVSLICVRQADNKILFYPLIENFHKDGILRYSIFPFSNKEIQSTAEKYASDILNHFKYVGVLVLEFFVTKDGGLIANEIAPRVHNSGHWSIEGSSMSQFEMHIRSITGTLQEKYIQNFKPSFMINILSKYPDEEKLSQLDNYFLHNYGKEERSLRKIGHLTVTKSNNKDLIESLQKFLSVMDD
tara:strand:+ start:1843 stop:2928 length:1086 start_codon:yes stop_codon:yes gene_type:complete